MEQTIQRNAIARLLRYRYAILTAIILIPLGFGFLRKFRDGDWHKTYLPSARHLWNGQSIYHAGDGYIYPPFPSLFALPFAYLPGILPHLLWYAVTVTCFIFICRWSWQLAGGPPLQATTETPPIEHFAFLVAVIPGATYAFNCISHSQTDIVIAFAIIAGCVALTYGKSFLAATLYGLAAAMKGPALIWFPYLIARRKPLAAGWMIAVFICVNLAPNLIGHQHSLLLGDWVHDYLVPKKSAMNVYPDVWFSESNQSLLGSINRWATTRWEWKGNDYQQRIPLLHPASGRMLKMMTFGAYSFLLSILATSLGWWPRPLERTTRSIRPALEFSMVAILMLVCSPMAAKAQWGILMLPGFCLARLCLIRRDPVVIFCFWAGFVAWVASQNFISRNGVFVGLWYGAVLWNALIWFSGCAYLLIFQRSETVTQVSI